MSVGWRARLGGMAAATLGATLLGGLARSQTHGAEQRADYERKQPARSAVETQLDAASMTRLSHGACPDDMVYARGFCVDRYEASMVDRDTNQPLSPYYPPHPRLLRSVFARWDLLRHESGDAAVRRMPLPTIPRWQRTHDFVPKAVSAPGKVPQAYVSYHTAKRACEAAGKRLCTEAEWLTACRGRWQTRFPYGNELRQAACNVHRGIHPAHVLHGLSSINQLDPRLNLLVAGEAPVLADTGSMPDCRSPWWRGLAAHDMVGNLDEWIEDEGGTFRGGFYARGTKRGCEATVASHTADYFDYSTGARCCLDPLTPEAASAR